MQGLRVISRVDEHAWQGLGVEFDLKSAARIVSDENVRHDRLDWLGAEFEARLRVELLDLGDYFGKVFGGNLCDAHQLRCVALRKELEIADHCGHRRIESVFLFELKGEALAQAPRADARRIEALDHRQHALDDLRRNNEELGGCRDVPVHITGVVDQIDQIGADQAVARVDAGDLQLFSQMVVQIGSARQGRFQRHRVFVVETPAARICIRRRSRFLRRRRCAVGDTVFAVDVIVIGIEIARSVGRRRVFAQRERCVGARNSFDFARVFARTCFVALEERILFELLLDECREFDVRHLQQLDRLLQLRRHDQRLALAELQSLGQRHGIAIARARTARRDRRAAHRYSRRPLSAYLRSSLRRHE